MHQPTPLPPSTVLRNEFAVVALSVLRRGDATSLVVTDTSSGASAVLDATELEALTRVPTEALRRLLLQAQSAEDAG